MFYLNNKNILFDDQQSKNFWRPIHFKYVNIDQHDDTELSNTAITAI